MSKKTAPEAIINAATAMLTPYFPELSATGLVEALKHRETASTADAATFRKPLTRAEAAEILKVSRPSIDRYIKRGTLRAYHIPPRLVRIDPRSVEELLHMQTATAPEA